MTDRSLALSLGLMLVLLGLFALACGPNGFSPEVLLAVTGRSADPASTIILLEIRLPRVLAAMIVGAALGLSGASLQAVTHNPLAEPGVLGVSASAVLGATLVLYFGLGGNGGLFVPVGAMVGATLATLVLLAVAKHAANTADLILVGVGLSSLAGAVMALVLNFAPNPFSLSDLINWTLGSVANRALVDVAYAAPLVALGSAILIGQRHGLTLLTLGDEAAAAHGLAVRQTRRAVVVGTGITTGAAVALAGAVGFVGMVAPHIVRPWTGHDPGRAIVPSALLGAAMITAADLLVRLLPTDTELRLGVVAALVGAPLFIWIAIKRAGRNDV